MHIPEGIQVPSKWAIKLQKSRINFMTILHLKRQYLSWGIQNR